MVSMLLPGCAALNLGLGILITPWCGPPPCLPGSAMWTRILTGLLECNYRKAPSKRSQTHGHRENPEKPSGAFRLCGESRSRHCQRLCPAFLLPPPSLWILAVGRGPSSHPKGT